MKITITLLDTEKIEFDTETFMCTADRVAFERRFGRSSMALAKMQELFDEEGKPRPGADLGDLREEWTVFFAWRCLRRAKPDVAPDFDQFAEEQIDAVQIGDGRKSAEMAERPPSSAPAPLQG